MKLTNICTPLILGILVSCGLYTQTASASTPVDPCAVIIKDKIILNNSVIFKVGTPNVMPGDAPCTTENKNTYHVEWGILDKVPKKFDQRLPFPIEVKIPELGSMVTLGNLDAKRTYGFQVYKDKELIDGFIEYPNMKPMFRQKLKLGMTGQDVINLQTWLFEYRVPVTGTFDAATEAAVKKFQKTARLKQDGIFGKATFDKLMKDLNKKNP